MYKFSKTSIERLETIDKRLQKILQKSLLVSPIDFGIPPYGGFRTFSEQRSLFQEKKSKCDGYLKQSYHQFGKAVDIYAYIQKKASWKKHHLALVAGVILCIAAQQGVPILWGATFDSYSFDGWDMGHFEIKE